MPPDTCEAAVDKLLAKDLASWTGLPAGCSLAALGKLEVGNDESRGLLGSERITTYFRRAKAPAYGETMKVWLRDGAIARISIPLPELPDPPALLRALGPPDAKLDAWFSTAPEVKKEAEWVYGKRGLALVLSSNQHDVMELIVFAPTTLDDYQKRLRYSEPPRELAD